MGRITVAECAQCQRGEHPDRSARGLFAELLTRVGLGLIREAAAWRANGGPVPTVVVEFVTPVPDYPLSDDR
jgi:hypothetical protein